MTRFGLFDGWAVGEEEGRAEKPSESDALSDFGGLLGGEERTFEGTLLEGSEGNKVTPEGSDDGSAEGDDDRVEVEVEEGESEMEGVEKADGVTDGD